MKNIIHKSIELNRYFNLISKRYSKWSFNLITVAFRIFIGLLFYFSIKNLLLEKAEIGLLFFIASITLIFFAELLNLLNKNSFISNYTLDIIDVFPLSKYEYFLNLFTSNILNLRGLYYFVIFILLFFVIGNYDVTFFLEIIILFVFIYFIASIIFTMVDFIYAHLIKYLGNRAKYSFLFLFLLLSWGMNSLDKYEINITFFTNLFKNCIYFFINK